MRSRARGSPNEGTGRLQCHAAREWRELRSEVKSVHHFQYLHARIRGAHPVPVRDPPIFEEPAAAGENNPPLGGGDLDDLRTFISRVVDRIEPEHAKQPGQAAKVNVENEACYSERLRA